MEAIPVLFYKKEDCCGCGACLNICPKQAISMKEDEYGFIYPAIDENMCIRCGQCKKVCAFQNREVTHEPIECFAAISKDEEQSKRSASGGIFAAIAEKVIEESGAVFGAAFTENWGVHHVKVETQQDLVALQGSKYAHSDIGRTFSEAKKGLLKGRQVLFSGTPCQVAGLYGFLGRDYENLNTVDIVCHGVPSSKMFQDYLKTVEDKHGGKITAFMFRDKSIGWGINGGTVINGKKVKIWQSESSYLYYFTQGWIYRENCYKCPYASEHRPADITLGDYWGIEKQHPEVLGNNGWNERNGISCVIVNTEIGKTLLKDINCEFVVSSFEKIKKGDAQLSKPSQMGKRNEIIRQYAESGWKGLSKRFNAQIGIKKYSSRIKAIIPVRLKRFLKSL